MNEFFLNKMIAHLFSCEDEENFVKQFFFWTYVEAATGGVLWKKVFSEISQNSQENTCARLSFLIRLQASCR